MEISGNIPSGFLEAVGAATAPFFTAAAHFGGSMYPSFKIAALPRLASFYLFQEVDPSRSVKFFILIM